MPSCHNNIEAHTNSNNYSQFGGSRKKRRSTRRRSTRRRSTRRRSTRRRSTRRRSTRRRSTRRRSTRRRSNLKIDESTYSLPSFTLLST